MFYSVASSNVVGKVLDDEAVVINLDTGIYYGLDGISAKVWELAVAGVPRDRLVGALTDRYPQETGIEQDVSAFLETLCSEGLLIADAAGTAAELPAVHAWPAVYSAPEMTSHDDIAEMIALDPPLPELSHRMIDQPS